MLALACVVSTGDTCVLERSERTVVSGFKFRQVVTLVTMPFAL